MEKKPIRRIEDFKVYQKSRQLFEEFLEKDLPLLTRSFAGRTLASNQLRCLDSICANMEEGFERKYGNDTKHFFRISKGSAGEARGRYLRLQKILPDDIINERVAVLCEIRAMLEALIRKWK